MNSTYIFTEIQIWNLNCYQKKGIKSKIEYSDKYILYVQMLFVEYFVISIKKKKKLKIVYKHSLQVWNINSWKNGLKYFHNSPTGLRN